MPRDFISNTCNFDFDNMTRQDLRDYSQVRINGNTQQRFFRPVRDDAIELTGRTIKYAMNAVSLFILAQGIYRNDSAMRNGSIIMFIMLNLLFKMVANCYKSRLQEGIDDYPVDRGASAVSFR